jgi:UDP-glucose 4-epimerase
MKKILVTGCSGYIGSHLCKMLEGKYILEGLDINAPIGISLSKFHNVDINTLTSWNTEYDTVIHLAALVRVGESELNPWQYYRTNLFGTANILNLVDSKHFIFASTGAAEFGGSPYAMSKIACEQIIPQLHHNYTIFRFYNVIGADGFIPSNPDGLMHKLIEAFVTGKFTIYGNDYNESHDGTPIRDYIHVNEICNAIKEAIEYGPTNSIESLGHGKGYSVKEIVEMFQKTNNIKFDVEYGPRRKGDLPVTVLKNVSKFMKPKYDIMDMLKIDNISI